MRRVVSIAGGQLLLSLALAVTPVMARAEPQRVLVLEFAGDRDNRIREDLQAALSQTGRVTLISRAELERAVESLNGYLGYNLTVSDARPVAKQLGAGTIVTATLSDDFYVRLYDSSGDVLWSRHMPLSSGTLAPEYMQRLTSAVVVASAVGLRRAGDAPTRNRASARRSRVQNVARETYPHEELELSPERKAALVEINASREAARRRREEAWALEQQARAVERLEAERTAMIRREAKFKWQLEQAAARYKAEISQREAELEHEREASAKRKAEAEKLRNEVSKRLEELAADQVPGHLAPLPPMGNPELAKITPATTDAR